MAVYFSLWDARHTLRQVMAGELHRFPVCIFLPHLCIERKLELMAKGSAIFLENTFASCLTAFVPLLYFLEMLSTIARQAPLPFRFLSVVMPNLFNVFRVRIHGPALILNHHFNWVWAFLYNLFNCLSSLFVI